MFYCLSEIKISTYYLGTHRNIRKDYATSKGFWVQSHTAFFDDVIQLKMIIVFGYFLGFKMYPEHY